MAPEIFTHARLQDGHIPFRMQSTTVDDGYASVAIAPAVDELLHVCDGFCSRLAVQVEHVARDVVSAFELSELAPIDTGRDVSLFRSNPIVIKC